VAIPTIGIFGSSPGNIPAAVKFKYAGVSSAGVPGPLPANFVVVFPTSGTTSTEITNPTAVLIGLNQNVVRGMAPGDYRLNVNFSTVDQNPPSRAGTEVLLRVSPPPGPPAITSLVNAASLMPAISPGGLVSI